MPRRTAHKDGVIAVGDIILECSVFIKLRPELIEVGDLQSGAQAAPTLLRAQRSEEYFEKRRLPRPVGADNADLVTADDGRGKVFDDLSLAESKTNLLGINNEPPAAFRLLNRNPRVSCLLPSEIALAPKLQQGSYSAFVSCATGLDSLPDPDLLPGQLLVEILPCLLFRIQHGLPAFEVGVVIAVKRQEATPVNLHDACRQTLKEGAVMGHEHYGLVEFEKEFLQPGDGVDVQVVGGLVQEEEIGIIREGLGQKDPAFQPRGKQSKLGIFIKTGPGDHGFDPLVKIPGAGCLQLVLNPFEFFQEVLVTATGEPHGQIMVLPQQIQMLPPAGSHDIIDRSRKIVGDILREQGNPDRTAFDDLPPVRRDLAIEHLQEGGLAGPVPAQQADPLALFNPERRAVQETRSAKTDGNIIDPDE
jgi:hypothetical protein